MTEYTIAVVEDDEDIRANVCRFLQKSGFGAWGAESAEDFYVRLLRDKADLVVVDLGLPGESGLSLVQRLAARRIPVIIQTALGGLGGVSFGAQVVGTLLGIAIAVGGAALVYGVLRATVGLRLDEEAEFRGADLSIHKISATPERDAGF